MNNSVTRTSVLFVCTGNICRSPIAEGVFRAFVQRAGLLDRVTIDSAGTGDSQVGQPTDPRAFAAASKRGYLLPNRRARQVGEGDFQRFEWILAMDRGNLRELESLRPFSYPGHLGLLLGLTDTAALSEVPDPYFGGSQEFDRVIDLVERGAEGLLAAIRKVMVGGGV
jgi:protein-tyrosine phosphatase